MPISNEFRVCECCKFPLPLRVFHVGDDDKTTCVLCYAYVPSEPYVGRDERTLGQIRADKVRRDRIIRTIRKAHGNIMREAL